MSDIWEDYDEETDGNERELKAEWTARKTQFYNSGYRDGVDVGREQTLQEGFDKGYALGIKAGLDWGRVQGGLRTIDYLKSKRSLAADLKVDETHSARVLATSDKDASDLICAHILTESGLPSGRDDKDPGNWSDEAKAILAAQEATLKSLTELWPKGQSSKQADL